MLGGVEDEVAMVEAEVGGGGSEREQRPPPSTLGYLAHDRSTCLPFTRRKKICEAPRGLHKSGLVRPCGRKRPGRRFCPGGHNRC